MVCCAMAKVGSVGSYETDVIPKRHLNANISASTYAANVKFFFLLSTNQGVLPCIYN